MTGLPDPNSLEATTKPFEQRRDESTERSIAHHQNHIAGLRFGDYPPHQLTDVRRRLGVDSLRAQRIDHSIDVELFVDGDLVVPVSYTHLRAHETDSYL